jgi:hypothetical protein
MVTILLCFGFFWAGFILACVLAVGGRSDNRGPD